MTQYFPIFGDRYPKQQWVSIDLSESNPELDFYRTAEPDYLDQFVHAHFSEQSKVAIGGYQEKRATYRSAANFSEAAEEEVRCIHLGIDLWVKAGTDVFAPLAGVVHSFNNNDLPFDYGPTIILRHDSGSEPFYTLYGHLSLDSLDGLAIGQTIEKGQRLASVGRSDINGGWSPHLHLQVMKSMFGWQGDFPGATSEKDKATYLANSPDPSFLLNL